MLVLTMDLDIRGLARVHILHVTLCTLSLRSTFGIGMHIETRIILTRIRQVPITCILFCGWTQPRKMGASYCYARRRMDAKPSYAS